MAKEEKTMEQAPAETSSGGVDRNDPLDLGVPMLEGSEKEPQGPEDALGVGPKRGDYRERVGHSAYHPHTTEAIPDDELERDDDGVVIGPRTRVVAQRPRTEDIGEVEGKKGGVTTTAS